MNSIGRRTEPWGTLHKQAHEEKQLSHLTWKVRLCSSRMALQKFDYYYYYYYLNNIKTDPWIENEGDRRVIRHVPWYQTRTSVGVLDYAQSVQELFRGWFGGTFFTAVGQSSVHVYHVRTGENVITQRHKFTISNIEKYKALNDGQIRWEGKLTPPHCVTMHHLT